MKTQAQYRKQVGNWNHCPDCDSDEIEGKSITIEANQASQDVYCQNCGLEWTDFYVLDGYQAIGKSQPKISYSNAIGQIRSRLATTPMRPESFERLTGMLAGLELLIDQEIAACKLSQGPNT